ncbi:general secretion pathway protein K [Moraxella macacae 0408225]|uniref:Type II secretion system protein K n=1 Tax=Moraxella macacae 0408225 TaxID=1230338 RepID=L2F853_9GAMM|nr:type II secretion system minor pseudopilin GspK [Moraxella macacae]ELA08638.1 general secretion pathway protein K [Moraxella macacae 0408225]
MKTTPQSSYRQSGVALLTILLLVVAIVVVAGSMLASQQVMLREYQLTQSQRQMQQAGQFAEAKIIQMLAKDSEINQTDSLQDVWTKPIAQQTHNGANLQIKLSDESSLFNINNLYHDGATDQAAVAYFQALLTAYGIDPSVAYAVLDWQDPDSDMTEGGAEADYYQSLGKTMSIPIANQPFTTVNELLYVRGMDKEKLQKIQPLLTAAPFFLPMNVNTLKPELLAAIGFIKDPQNGAKNQPTPPNASTQNTPMPTKQGGLDLLALTNWANRRDTAMPLDTVENLWQIPAMLGVASHQKQTMAALLDVQSRMFVLTTVVTIDDKQRVFRSQLAKVQLPPQPDKPNLPNSQQNQIVIFNRQVLPFSK